MKAGSLEIEIFANLARLQSDMNAMKAAVGGGLAGVDSSFNRARASSERYLASLEAEASKIGKTSAAIKQMEIEANAVAASAGGFDDLAQKIRSAGAAMEQAKVDAAALAAEKDKLAAETREAAEAEAKHASALSALRASVDPVGTAQARVNDQMQIAATAYQRGEMGADEYARTTKVLETRLEEMKVAQDRANGSVGGIGKTAVLTKSQMLNLGYQVQDLSIQMLAAAQSTSPLKMGFMALMQQGAQIQGIGAQAGISLGGMAKAAVSMIASVSKAVLLNPIFLGIAAAVGVAYGAFKYFQGEVKKSGELERYAKSLGMTKEELAKAGGAAVTFGDVLKGTWKTISDGLGLDKVFKGIGDWASSAFETVLSAAKTAVTWIYGGFVGTYRAVIATWQMFPAVLGELFVNGTNAAIEAINKLIKAAIDGVNWLAQQANDFLGTNLFGKIGDYAIDTMENKFAGAGAKVGGVFVDEIGKGIKEGEAGLNRSGAALWKNIIGAGEARIKAGDKADKSKPKVDKHAEALAREAEAANAAIKGLWSLADAYGVSDAAALRAEATAKAIEKSIKKRGDQELFVAQELRKVVAERARDTAKMAADANFQAQAQEMVNAQVEAGTLAAGRASDALNMLVENRSALAAIELAEGDEKQRLIKILDSATAARIRELKAKNQAAALAQMASNDDEIERLKLETDMLGASNRERAVAIARLKAEQELKSRPGVDPATFIANAVALANAEEDAREKTLAHNEALNEQVRILDLIDERANVMADTLGNAFGRVGGALGGLMTEMTGYAAHQAKLDKEREDRLRDAGSDAKQRAKVETEMSYQSKTAQMQHYGALISTAKSFFKENSAGYKVMAAAEKAFAIVQLAGTAIDVARGAAKMFSFLGPFAFPAVAAMMGVMASLGFGGGGGGGGSFKPPTAEEVQASQGTGSVLGDGDAKSGSIANSLALMLKNTNKDLEYSNEMVRSLRAIETNIGMLTNQLARQLGVTGGDFDTSGFGLGKSTSMGIGKYLLGIPGLMGIVDDIPIIGGLISGIAKALFGTKKTVTLLDQGITFATQTVQDIINSGAIGQIYSDIQTQTKKKFLGITTSNKTKVTTEYGDLDNDMERQVALIIGSLRAGVLDAAGILGVDGAQAALDAFTVNIGKISLKDLTGTEIQEQLEAVFGKLGDDMAKAALPGLEAFQRVGEGVFETLARLAKDYATIDVALTSIGMTFGSVGMASIEAREALIDLFGGLDEFASQTNFFRENFLTDAEQMAPIISAVQAEMARLGVAGTTTKEQFKDLVLGLDLSTEGGQDMYASLLAVAPAFSKVIEYLGSLDGELAETGKTAAELAAIAKKSRELDIALADALGNSTLALTMRREDDLAAIDETLRAKQAEVWAAQDAAAAAKELAAANEAAAKAAEVLAEKRRSMEIAIMELEGDAIGALAAKRADELAALDPTLRALQDRIYALQDAAAAEEAAATAAQALAEAETQAAEQRNAIADQRARMEIELLRAQGNVAAAVVLEREREVAALDESLRSLQLAIYAAQDLAAATGGVVDATDLLGQRRSMEIELMRALGDEAGALAATRADELITTHESLRALREQIYAAEDAARAQEELARQIEKRSSLELELMRALGDEEGALAIERQAQLAALDPLTAALQEQVWAAQAAAAANQALAQAQQEAAQVAAQIAIQRRSLEIELLRAQGQEEAALLAERADKLAALDPSLVELQKQVWAMQDATAAAAASAQAAADAERARQQAAEEAARAEKQASEELLRQWQEITEKRTSLEIELLRATGREAEAVNAERMIELATLDLTLHALQKQVWAAQDAAKAQAALAEAAEKAEQLRKSAVAMDVQILELQGRATEATALKRREELAALDASLRSRQLVIWQLEDAKAAEEARADAIGKSRDTLTQAYKRESDALKGTIDRMRELGDSLRAFRGGLVAGIASPVDIYQQARIEFDRVAALAKSDDAAISAKALGDLEGVSKAFLDASKSGSSSLLQYQRDVSLVAQAVDAGIIASANAVDVAQAQLDALNDSVRHLIDIDEHVISVVEAIEALGAALVEEPTVPTVPANTPGLTTPADTSDPQIAELQATVAAQNTRIEALLTSIKDSTSAQKTFMERWDAVGAPVRNPNNGETLKVEEAA